MGSVDELNCQLGIIVAGLTQDHALRSLLIQIQNQLFDLGGMLSLAEKSLEFSSKIDNHCSHLDVLIERYNSQLPALEEFVLPGGCLHAARTHLARSVCRRAERDLWQLMQDHSYPSQMGIYLNRLSDFLFILARYFNKMDNNPELSWQHD